MTLFNLKIMRLSGYAIISAVIFMLAGTANEINAQESDRRDVRRGNRQFKDGNYKEAVVDYQKALLRDSTSFAASYNSEFLFGSYLATISEYSLYASSILSS